MWRSGCGRVERRRVRWAHRPPPPPSSIGANPKVGEGLAPSPAGGRRSRVMKTEPSHRPPPPQPSPARAPAPRPERERAPPPENVGCAPRTVQLPFLGLGGGGKVLFPPPAPSARPGGGKPGQAPPLLWVGAYGGLERGRPAASPAVLGKVRSVAVVPLRLRRLGVPLGRPGVGARSRRGLRPGRRWRNPFGRTVARLRSGRPVDRL